MTTIETPQLPGAVKYLIFANRGPKFSLGILPSSRTSGRFHASSNYPSLPAYGEIKTSRLAHSKYEMSVYCRASLGASARVRRSKHCRVSSTSTTRMNKKLHLVCSIAGCSAPYQVVGNGELIYTTTCVVLGFLSVRLKEDTLFLHKLAWLGTYVESTF
jgi:hypothetical protein